MFVGRRYESVLSWGGSTAYLELLGDSRNCEDGPSGIKTIQTWPIVCFILDRSNAVV